MDLLINLDSPVVRSKLKADYTSRSPLIPCPSFLGISEPQNNPFDAVANAVELNQQPEDPFDLVLLASMDRDKERVIKSEGNSPQIAEDKDDTRIQTPGTCNEEIDLSEIENNVKEFVSKRIISCIEKTISSSTSQTDLTKNKKSQKYFRRSFSAGVVRQGNFSTISEESVTNHRSTNLNTSLPSRGYHLSSSSRHSPESLIEKLERDTKMLAISTCNNFEITKKDLREEAERISKLINYETSSNITVESEAFTNDSDDLLYEKPPWECSEVALSDEEDSIGLPKLKTYRHSFSGMIDCTNQPAIEETALNRYMKRRLSADLVQPNEDKQEDDTNQPIECFTPEQVVASSSLLEDSDKIPSVEPKPVEKIEEKKIETHLVNDINIHTLRPKKKTGKELLKKGPMKAVVPLQKMSRNIGLKISSPFKNKTQCTSKKSKDDSLGENVIQPVAASTPTKSISPISNSSAYARMRGRENNKMSPTGRKAARRSNSVGIVENKISNKILTSPGSPKINSVKSVERKTLVRPQSAPDASLTEHNSSKIRRTVLQALLPRPLNRVGRITEMKAKSKVKHPATVSAQDKENQGTLNK